VIRGRAFGAYSETGSRSLCHDATVTLPEDEPIADIVAWFTEQGFELELHQDPPTRPDPRTVSRALRHPPDFSHWCGVGAGQQQARWYGGGWSEDEAIRSARARWRVEQQGHEPTERRLP